MADQRFLILSLPRSRSTWLANLLTWGPSHCAHDLSCQVGSLAAFRARLAHTMSRYAGAADTGLSIGAEYQYRKSDGPLVLVFRPVEDVIQATCAAFPQMPKGIVEELVWQGQAGLERLRAQAALVLTYDELDDVTAVRKLWNTCLPDGPDGSARIRQLMGWRITVDPARYVAGITPEAVAWLRQRRVTRVVESDKGAAWQR